MVGHLAGCGEEAHLAIVSEASTNRAGTERGPAAGGSSCDRARAAARGAWCREVPHGRAMMDDRDEATELEIELAETLGRALLRDPDHPAWSDGRFLNWLGAD